MSCYYGKDGNGYIQFSKGPNQMADFTSAAGALNDGKHVRRSEWGQSSTMYVDQDKQLMRIGPNGNSYGWMLDLNDINATDWQTVAPTSTRHLNQIQLC